MDIEVAYIIHEISKNKTTYRIIQHSSGKMRDVGKDYVEKYGISAQNAKYIEINDLDTFSGRLKKGINDFETYCRLHDMQTLLLEYNTNKNNKCIDEISKGAIDKVWWKCSKCGHEWESIIKTRTTQSTGCPMCMHKQNKYHILVKGSNDLLTWCKNNEREDIIREYSSKNKIAINSIAAKSHDKVIWECTVCKKEYISILANRTDKGQGCPNCSRNGTSFPERFIFEFISDSINNVKYRYKVSGLEIDIYIPDLKLAIDYRGNYWHEDRQEMDDYKETIINNMGINQIIIVGDRTSENINIDSRHIVFNEKDYNWLGCILTKLCKLDTQCSSKSYIEEVFRAVIAKQNSKEVINSLAKTHPDVASRWDYELNGDFKPTNITYGTKYKAWFKCKKCNRSYYSLIRKQVIGQGCPYCYRDEVALNRMERQRIKSLPKETQYGDWTVVEKVSSRKFICKCVCGVTKEISDSSLWHLKKKGYKCKHTKQEIRSAANKVSTTKIQYNSPIPSIKIDKTTTKVEKKDTTLIEIRQNESTVRFLKDMQLVLGKSNEYSVTNNSIILPNKKVKIEFVDSSIKQSKKYRQQKTIACAKQGIHLIHIFDYEWADTIKRNKLTNYINSFITQSRIYYARDLVIQRINSKEAKDFQDKYHLQNSVNSEYDIALLDNNEIISVMSFRSPRFDHSYEWEITRYCNKDGVIIVGGAERMFKHFIKLQKPNSILTYVDISKFTGNVYTKLGFKPTQEYLTIPNYVWVNTHFDVLPRYKTQKRKLLEKGLGVPEQTEDEIMENQGYYKVFDSGNLKLEWIAT